MVNLPVSPKKLFFGSVIFLIASVIIICIAVIATAVQRPISLQQRVLLPQCHGQIGQVAHDPTAAHGGRLFVTAPDVNRVYLVQRKAAGDSRFSSESTFIEHELLNRPTGVTFDSINGKLVVVNSGDSRIVVFNPNPAGGFDFLSSIEITPPNIHGGTAQFNGSYVYVSFQDGIAVLDLAGENITRLDDANDVPLNGPVDKFILDSQSQELFAIVPSEQTLVVINNTAADGTGRTLTFKVPGEPRALGRDAVSGLLMVGTRSLDRLALLEGSDLSKVVALLDTVPLINGVSFDHKRQRIYATGAEGHVTVYHKHSEHGWEILAEIQDPNEALGSSIFLDGLDRLVAGSADLGPSEVGPADSGEFCELHVYYPYKKGVTTA